MARPIKLTPEIQKALCDCLRSGCYAVTACARAGISESTYYLWLQKGEAGQRPYLEFLESVKKADADAEALLAATVMRVALDSENPCWQAAMTMLERRHPERWGRRLVEAKVAIDGEVTIEHDFSNKLTTPERLASVAGILGNLGLLAAGSTGDLAEGTDPAAE
jgi:hypothetical protein